MVYPPTTTCSNGPDHQNCISAEDKAAGFNWAWNSAGSRVVAELHRYSAAISGQHNVILPAKTGTEQMRFVGGGERITATLNLKTYTVTVTLGNG